IDLTMNPQQIQSNNFTATSGGTTLAAQMTLSQYTGNAPNVDATLKTVNGKVNELLGIAKAYGITAVEGMSGTGNISLDIHATGPIKNTNAMNFSGSGALQNASLKVPSLTQPVNVRNANLQFTQNSVNLTNLAASLGSTNASGNLSVANFQAPRLTFALAADKLNVVELQKNNQQFHAQTKSSGQEESRSFVEPGPHRGCSSCAHGAAGLARQCDGDGHHRSGHDSLPANGTHQCALQRDAEPWSHPTQSIDGTDRWRTGER